VPQVQFRLKSLLVVVAILAIAMALLPPLWRIVSLDWVDDSYVLWGAGEMVVDYMKDHDGRWPKGWADLKPYFDAGGGRVGGWSFQEYQRQVTIGWDVDPRALDAAARANPRPTFRVIAAKGWLAGNIGGHEPNEILYRYFRGRPGL
jgi:hypothetical protein